MNPWKLIALTLLAGLTLSTVVDEASVFGVCHDQPNMTAALASLKSARASLAKAEHNKGGWRDAATAATDKAIRREHSGLRLRRYALSEIRRVIRPPTPALPRVPRRRASPLKHVPA